MADRLCPVDEAWRLYLLMTPAERVRLLAKITTGCTPLPRARYPDHSDDCDRDPRVVRLEGKADQ